MFCIGVDGSMAAKQRDRICTKGPRVAFYLVFEALPQKRTIDWCQIFG
jgi:hypothetical protein